MAIRYVAYTREGERVSGTLPVDSEEAAQELLWRSDLTVVSLKRERRLRFNIYEQLPTLFGPKPHELVAFTRELANLLQSGIALLPSLQLLLERVRSPLFKRALQIIIQDIETGVSFSQAISRHPKVFPPIYSRLVIVGEQAGRLALMLHQIANYLEKQAMLTAKIKSSLRYPSFVVFVGVAAAILLGIFALPTISNLFKEFGAKLPLPAHLLIVFSDFIKVWGIWVLIGAVIFAFILSWYIRTPHGLGRWDRFTLRAPVIGNLVRYNNLSRFAHTLHTLLTAGIPMSESIDLTMRTSQNAVIRDALRKVNQDVLRGEMLSQALARQKVFPSLVPQLISVGEQSGTLESNMETLANFFDRQAERTAASLTSLIEPVVVMIVGLMVGFIAMAIFTSLYGLIGQLK